MYSSTVDRQISYWSQTIWISSMLFSRHRQINHINQGHEIIHHFPYQRPLCIIWILSEVVFLFFFRLTLIIIILLNKWKYWGKQQNSRFASARLWLGNQTSMPRFSLSWLAFATSEERPHAWWKAGTKTDSLGFCRIIIRGYNFDIKSQNTVYKLRFITAGLKT